MDNWEDFGRQRPALVTSDTSRWYSGNKSVFSFLYTLENIYLIWSWLTMKKCREIPNRFHYCVSFLLHWTKGIFAYHLLYSVTLYFSYKTYVLLCTFTSSVTTPQKKRTDNNNQFKASILPTGFILHTFELSQRNKFLKFQIFLSATWSSEVTLSYSHNINQQPPAILISVALYHKCIHTHGKHLRNSKCKQSTDWLLQSSGHRQNTVFQSGANLRVISSIWHSGMLSRSVRFCSFSAPKWQQEVTVSFGVVNTEILEGDVSTRVWCFIPEGWKRIKPNVSKWNSLCRKRNCCLQHSLCFSFNFIFVNPYWCHSYWISQFNFSKQGCLFEAFLSDMFVFEKI